MTRMLCLEFRQLERKIKTNTETTRELNPWNVIIIEEIYKKYICVNYLATFIFTWIKRQKNFKIIKYLLLYMY